MSSFPVTNGLRYQRQSQLVREREILRVAGDLDGSDQHSAMKVATDQVLRWAQSKAVSKFGAEAWEYLPFEQVSGGRSRVVVRVDDEIGETWAIRVEDPDATMPGRIWTTEIALTRSGKSPVRLSVRQLVASPESTLAVEPHVPGLVRQIISNPGLQSRGFKLSDKPLVIRTEENVRLLIDALLDPSRTLPIIILSVPVNASDPLKPLIDSKALAQSCAALAMVVILPAELTWTLTERFGQRLSVFGGAIRIYLQGFTEDANPFGGHDLILPERFIEPQGMLNTMRRLRWSAALGSISRLKLGVDVVPFASLRLQSLEKLQANLKNSGGSDKELLEAAQQNIKLLQVQLAEEARLQKDFSDLYEEAEERARGTEAQLLASGFRINQLQEQLKAAGAAPDASIQLPKDWSDFDAWCDNNLAGRVRLSPQARRSLKDAKFEDVEQSARCLLWLANDLRAAKLESADGPLRDRVIESGVTNAHCGNDSFELIWQGRTHLVEWHIKNGGNSHNPARCLRVYYFWDDTALISVIAAMPQHLRTSAT